LRAGLDTDHASLGARVQSATEDIPRLEVMEVLENCDAYRRGLDLGDELIAFAGRPMSTVNEFKNVLGIFPKDWRMPLEFRRKTERKEALVRLQGVMVKQEEDEDPNKPKPPGPNPRPAAPPIPDTPAKKLYVEKKGFANYHFNELNQKRLWESFVKHGDFSKLKGDWVIDADMDLPSSKTTCRLTLTEQKISANETHPVVKFVAGTDYSLDPLKQNLVDAERTAPTGSGGLLMAFHHYRVLLTQGLAGFGRNVAHGGQEPFYPYPVDGSKPKKLRDLRVDTEVLRTETAGVPAKWYFSKTDQTLLGFEVFPENNADPCEVYFSDYKTVDGRQLPHRIEIRNGDNRFAVLTVKSYKLESK
jgi:serine protease Do